MSRSNTPPTKHFNLRTKMFNFDLNQVPLSPEESAIQEFRSQNNTL